ncbi:glycosyltransferase family 2 protein [Psychrobacter sp. 72-O-c]|uniref:glycosyltransferase family 2 protein n=1 Tax=Psychrobacter sp. 72-O-c TaxID=2774125 RepID=UPI00191A85C5|nr:glycosyltransferase [Psychrobacter sp. 72-O-c]
MKSQSYISIGIPIYNAENYLEDAINSVLTQTHKYWELILIDDGSNDKSLEIAKKFERIDNRIRVISDGFNKKLPSRLNQIIDESKYQYIARMDADDIIHPERLEIQIKFLENNPNYDLVSTGVITIDNDNQVYGYRNVDQVYTDFEKVEKAYPIVHPAILAKKNWYSRNNYDVNYTRSEDYELWCRAISNKDLKIAVLPDLLYYYREKGNLSSSNIIKTYKDTFTTYCEYKQSFDLLYFSKVRLKIFIVKTVDYLGLLQNMASRRNKKDISDNVKKEHQNIINKLKYM